MKSKSGIIWAAGFVDGEGYIFIRRQPPTLANRKKSMIYCLVLGVNNTSYPALVKLRAIFGGSIVSTTGSILSKKQLWRWTVERQMALSALMLLSPYLIVKKREALIAVEFYRYCFPKRRRFTGGVAVPEKELRLRELYRVRLHEAKHESQT